MSSPSKSTCFWHYSCGYSVIWMMVNLSRQHVKINGWQSHIFFPLMAAVAVVLEQNCCQRLKQLKYAVEALCWWCLWSFSPHTSSHCIQHLTASQMLEKSYIYNEGCLVYPVLNSQFTQTDSHYHFSFNKL